jgi:hypothetical protein
MDRDVVDPGDQAAHRDGMRRYHEHQPERDRCARRADHCSASGSPIDPGRTAAKTMAPTGQRSP